MGEDCTHIGTRKDDYNCEAYLDNYKDLRDAFGWNCADAGTRNAAANHFNVYNVHPGKPGGSETRDASGFTCYTFRGCTEDDYQTGWANHAWYPWHKLYEKTEAADDAVAPSGPAVGTYYTKDGWGAMDFTDADGVTETYYLVRRVSGQGRMCHKADDNGLGTDVYGAYAPPPEHAHTAPPLYHNPLARSYDSDPLSTEADFSVGYDQYAVGKADTDVKYILASGNMKNWVHANRQQMVDLEAKNVRSTPTHPPSPTRQLFSCARFARTQCHNCMHTWLSTSSGVTTSAQYSRHGYFPYDPYIGAIDHLDIAYGAQGAVYCEAGNGGWHAKNWAASYGNRYGEQSGGHNVWVNSVEVEVSFEPVFDTAGISHSWCAGTELPGRGHYSSHQECESKCARDPACNVVEVRQDNAPFGNPDTFAAGAVWCEFNSNDDGACAPPQPTPHQTSSNSRATTSPFLRA
jgi:hypothetical protein